MPSQIPELRSARARHKRYVGEWLPEPIITDGEDHPTRSAETADSLSLATLGLLESLSPEKRAVLVLRDPLDYRHPEITTIIGKSEVNARQLATCARDHLERGRPHFQATREQRDDSKRQLLLVSGDAAPRSTLGSRRRHSSVGVTARRAETKVTKTYPKLSSTTIR